MVDVLGGCLEAQLFHYNGALRGMKVTGRESQSLFPNVCFTKRAINSFSGFLSFLGTPHPSPHQTSL